jgi:hypothetical protein
MIDQFPSNIQKRQNFGLPQSLLTLADQENVAISSSTRPEPAPFQGS